MYAERSELQQDCPASLRTVPCPKSYKERSNGSHVGEPFLPERRVARFRELEMVRMGYVVEEPLYDDILGDIVLPVNNKGGDVDI